jgi:hypothetical protein
MNTNRSRLYWGFVFLLVGGFFLAINLELIAGLTGNFWAITFAVLSLLFFVGYFTGGIKNWGWLFPAMGTGAIAATIWLLEAGIEGSWLGSLFMFCIAVPFWVAYLTNRDNWWALIPAWAMTTIGLIVILADTAADEIIGSLVMFSIALPFFVVFFRNRVNWWALIPAWIMTSIGTIILLADTASDELIGTLILVAIALPFFVVFIRNRANWWALFPAGILTLIGLVVLISERVSGEIVGGVLTFGIGLVFLFVYLSWRQNWWALIPAGVIASIGAGIILAGMNLTEAFKSRLMGGFIFGGMGATFLTLWLMREKYGTDWAKYPAMGLLAFAGLVLIFGARTELVWPIMMIAIGLWLLYRSTQPAS